METCQWVAQAGPCGALGRLSASPWRSACIDCAKGGVSSGQLGTRTVTLSRFIDLCVAPRVLVLRLKHRLEQSFLSVEAAP